jgi:chromosome segregation ATPase
MVHHSAQTGIVKPALFRDREAFMKAIKWVVVTLALLLAAGGLQSLAAEEDAARKAYDRMVEEAAREADAYLDEKAKERSQKPEDTQAKQDPALTERIQAERERIETEMDAVRQRGLGPNFTLGMKENQLEELQDKLNQLLGDPQAYFGE